MQIISVIKDSFQEYEGEHSLVLFSKGCNINCSFCYNKEAMNNPPIGDAIDIINKELTPLHTAVVLCGGEPTIWKDIADVCQAVKLKKLKVKLFTNAMNMKNLKVLTDCELVDFVSIDFKCSRNVYQVLFDEAIKGVDEVSSKLSYFEHIMQAITNCSNMCIPYEIRTTYFDGMSVEELNEIKKIVKEWTAKDRFFKGHIIQDDFRENIKLKIAKLGE